MTEKFKIAIVGAGPAGLSAAARAAELGVSHVVLEASPNLANTVYHYPRGKLVMAEPARLPLRSVLSFSVGSRENILHTWRQEAEVLGVNLRTEAPVAGLSGQRGDFRIALASGESVGAESVVLAIGLQGNIRRLGVPGENLPGVQYQLDDPDEYRGETILVVGGGDSAIENALALASRNRVILVIRQEEFTKCGEENFARLKEAIKLGQVETQVGTSVISVEAQAGNGFPLALHVQTPQGEEWMLCHRIIARLGADPPRRTLERFGIVFPSEEHAAVPVLSERYESNVPGLYIVGALGGCPHIKQALNQGYEVVDHILGRPIASVEEPFLFEKLSLIPGLAGRRDALDILRGSLPLFESLSRQQLREMVMESEVHSLHAGDIVFRQNDYNNAFFSVLQGAISVVLEKEGAQSASFDVTAGGCFGEVGLFSGRRRAGTAIAGEDCVLLETPRRFMVKLLDAAPGVRRSLDEVALKRLVLSCYGTALPEDQIDHLVHEARVKRYAAGDLIFTEGEEADALYLIRRGSVTLSRRVDGKDTILTYLSAGNSLGDMAVVPKTPRIATARAASATELVVLDAQRFNALLDQNPAMRAEVASRYLERVGSYEAVASNKNSELIQFLMKQGVGEATDVLLIDYSRCIRCNNCEVACAEAHDGASRLRRDAGQTFAQLHIPASCRHCEHPYCMKDCPPDAIHRALNGEVFITDACIGCGNCQTNCPYGVIQMVDRVEYRPPSLLQWLLGLGKAAVPKPREAAESTKKMAVKCDMCREIIGGAACVRACPTGAAFRVSPEQFLTISQG